MKPLLVLLLGASLAANALLVLNRDNAAAPFALTRPGSSGKNAPDVPALPPETWALVTAGDPSAVAKLRELGLPDTVIRALMRHQIDLRYRDREKALYANNDAFWKREYAYASWRATDPGQALDLRREKNAEIKALLGDLAQDDNVNTDYRTAFLPAAKAEQLRLVREDYEALRQPYQSYDGVTLPEDREKLALLEREERADLVQLLTPEELAAYDLRNSRTAQQLRYQLAAFDATEEEYKTIFALRQDYDTKHLPQNAGTVLYSMPQGPQKAREELAAQIKAALGDERYAVYERSQDNEYRTLSSIAKRLDIPAEKVVEAHALKVALDKKARDFRPVPGTPPTEQRTAFRATLAQEAETGFTALLGEKGYATYQEYGQFPRSLRPPPAPTPKP